MVLLVEGTVVCRALCSSKLGGPDEAGEDFVANRALMFCSESSSKSAVLQSDMNSMTVVLLLWVEDPSAQVRMIMQ